MAFKRSAVRSRLSPPPKILEPQWFQDFSFLYGSMKRVVLLTLFQQPRGVSSADISSAMDCLRATSRWPYTLAIILMSLCPQPFLHILERKAVAQQKAGAAIPLRYNYDKPEKPRISRAFGYLARFFILFQTEKSSHEVVIGPLLYIIKIPAAYAAGIRS